MSNFKKINHITRAITNKIFKKYDYNFILINESWLQIVGNKFYDVSSPASISRHNILTVDVKRDYVLDFQYAIPSILLRIEEILENTESFKIKIRQKH